MGKQTVQQTQIVQVSTTTSKLYNKHRLYRLVLLLANCITNTDCQVSITTSKLYNKHRLSG